MKYYRLINKNNEKSSCLACHSEPLKEAWQSNNHNLSDEVIIEIEYKKVKNFNLRILSDNKVKCSVPLNTQDDEVIKFCKSKEKWILRNNEKNIKTQSISTKNILKNGGSVKILGHYYSIIIIKESAKNSIEVKDKYLIINIKNDLSNIEDFFRQYFKKEMINYYERLIDKFYPIIKKYDKKKPELRIRKMSKCWGKSNPDRNFITLNEALYMAHPFCIEYIVLHEITHFLYPYHNKQFYDFISIYMPDWKERRKRLNLEFNV